MSLPSLLRHGARRKCDRLFGQVNRTSPRSQDPWNSASASKNVIAHQNPTVRQIRFGAVPGQASSGISAPNSRAKCVQSDNIIGFKAWSREFHSQSVPKAGKQFQIGLESNLDKTHYLQRCGSLGSQLSALVSTRTGMAGFGSKCRVFPSQFQRMGISTDAISEKLKVSQKNFLNVFKGKANLADPVSKKFNAAPAIVKKPLEAFKDTALRYKEAARLQAEAFWRRNVMILVGAAGVLSCFLLWQLMYGVANMFVSFSEGMAKFGFLAMAAATVAFSAMALRARYVINPDKVYRIVMRKLNTSAAALEVLGPPLTGTELRAYVMASGGLKLKNFRPRLGSRRCFLIFPIQGSDKKGLVSVEVKKKKGKYDFKLLAVDVAMPGAEQRIFLIGDESEYNVGGGLVKQLRDPIMKVMNAQEEFDAQDEKEIQEEEKAEQEKRAREIKEEEARQKEELEKLAKES